MTRTTAIAPPPYPVVLERLQARGRFGIRLGLGRTRALLRELGDPHRGLRGALIGGTNGKGSVQAIVAAVLAQAGYRTAQTPKPHLVSYRERIVVDGRPIAPEAFATLVDEVLSIADRLTARLGAPTEFEVLTAAAMSWFAQQDVDLAVVEVGLGGRLDATNAWDGGVAAITNVEWDHMDRLGDTLERIAREKAAIIKRGDVAITGAADPGLSVIRRRARRLGVPLAEAPALRVLRMTREGLWLQHPSFGELRTGLLGRHQATNVAVALGVLDALDRTALARIPAAAVRTGLADVRWAARSELLTLCADGRAVPASGDSAEPGAPDVLLDGAHNASGAAALAATVEELRPTLSPGRPTLLLGAVRDKDVESILAPLARAEWTRDARLVATRVPSDRGLDAVDLAAAWQRQRDRAGRTGGAIRETASVMEALDDAIESARAEDGPLVVAGSLYLVGAVRGRLVDDPSLRDPG